MKKNISNFGNILSREVQKTIQGGFGFVCNGAYPNPEDSCPPGTYPFPDPMIGDSVCCEVQFPY